MFYMYEVLMFGNLDIIYEFLFIENFDVKKICVKFGNKREIFLIFLVLIFEFLINLN